MPGIADKFTQSAQGRLRWPGTTSFAKSARSIGCIPCQTPEELSKHASRRMEITLAAILETRASQRRNCAAERSSDNGAAVTQG
jgi:hypothetical protein